MASAPWSLPVWLQNGQLIPDRLGDSFECYVAYLRKYDAAGLPPEADGRQAGAEEVPLSVRSIKLQGICCPTCNGDAAVLRSASLVKSLEPGSSTASFITPTLACVGKENVASTVSENSACTPCGWQVCLACGLQAHQQNQQCPLKDLYAAAIGVEQLRRQHVGLPSLGQVQVEPKASIEPPAKRRSHGHATLSYPPSLPPFTPAPPVSSSLKPYKWSGSSGIGASWGPGHGGKASAGSSCSGPLTAATAAGAVASGVSAAAGSAGAGKAKDINGEMDFETAMQLAMQASMASSAPAAPTPSAAPAPAAAAASSSSPAAPAPALPTFDLSSLLGSGGSAAGGGGEKTKKGKSSNKVPTPNGNLVDSFEAAFLSLGVGGGGASSSTAVTAGPPIATAAAEGLSASSAPAPAASGTSAAAPPAPAPSNMSGLDADTLLAMQLMMEEGDAAAGLPPESSLAAAAAATAASSAAGGGEAAGTAMDVDPDGSSSNAGPPGLPAIDGATAAAAAPKPTSSSAGDAGAAPWWAAPAPAPTAASVYAAEAAGSAKWLAEVKAEAAAAAMSSSAPPPSAVLPTHPPASMTHQMSQQYHAAYTKYKNFSQAGAPQSTVGNAGTVGTAASAAAAVAAGMGMGGYGDEGLELPDFDDEGDGDEGVEGELEALVDDYVAQGYTAPQAVAMAEAVVYGVAPKPSYSHPAAGGGSSSAAGGGVPGPSFVSSMVWPGGKPLPPKPAPHSTYWAGGTGFGGDQHSDGAILQRLEATRKAAAEVRDPVIGAAMHLLRAAVTNVSIEDDKNSQFGGGDAAMSGSLASASALASSALTQLAIASSSAGLIPAGSERSLVTAIRSMLLQVLAGPGYGDGITVQVPAATAASGDAAAASSSSSAASSAAASAAGEARLALRRRISELHSAGGGGASSSGGDNKALDLKIGSGDGVLGPSALVAVITSYLRSSFLELSSASQSRRDCYFAMLSLLNTVSKDELYLPLLVYTPDQPSALSSSSAAATASSSSSSSSSASAAPAQRWTPWSAPKLRSLSSSGANKKASLPVGCIAALLASFRAAADAYVRNVSGGGGSSAAGSGKHGKHGGKGHGSSSGGADFVTVGSDDAEFLAVLCLANDVRDAADVSRKRVDEWAGKPENRIVASAAGAGAGAAPSEIPAAAVDDDMAIDGEIVDGEMPAGSGVASGEGASSSSAAAGLSAPASAAPAQPASSPSASPSASTPSQSPTSTSGAIFDALRVPASLLSSSEGDVIISRGIGTTDVSAFYSPPEDTVAAYKEALEDEAYSQMAGLGAEHYHTHHAAKVGRYGNASSGGGSGTSQDRSKRLMKVAAEMARLATESDAIHWGSSILVRSDEAQMDLMRAAITGPAGTPYQNGFFTFDISLPPEYPQVSPAVQFLTTGGGTVRFNPNLYVDGKVCLSLLGTWSGPGWTPGVSTLSQVLLSIQSAILVEQPFGNEPGFERQLSQPSGKRAVAKHNIHLRLATMRHAMLEPLQKTKTSSGVCKGFERAVHVHFYHKRDEIKAQVIVWCEEALIAAKYEAELEERSQNAKKILDAVQKAIDYGTVSSAQSSWNSALHAHAVFSRGGFSVGQAPTSTTSSAGAASSSSAAAAAAASSSSSSGSASGAAGGVAGAVKPGSLADLTNRITSLKQAAGSNIVASIEARRSQAAAKIAGKKGSKPASNAAAASSSSSFAAGAGDGGGAPSSSSSSGGDAAQVLATIEDAKSSILSLLASIAPAASLAGSLSSTATHSTLSIASALSAVQQLEAALTAAQNLTAIKALTGGIVAPSSSGLTLSSIWGYMGAQGQYPPHLPLGSKVVLQDISQVPTLNGKIAVIAGGHAYFTGADVAAGVLTPKYQVVVTLEDGTHLKVKESKCKPLGPFSAGGGGGVAGGGGNKVYESSSCGAVGCGKLSAIQKCARCLSIFYCDEVCQKADWKRHKQECTPASAAELAAAKAFAATLTSSADKAKTAKSKSSSSGGGKSSSLSAAAAASGAVGADDLMADDQDHDSIDDIEIEDGDDDGNDGNADDDDDGDDNEGEEDEEDEDEEEHYDDDQLDGASPVPPPVDESLYIVGATVTVVSEPQAEYNNLSGKIIAAFPTATGLLLTVQPGATAGGGEAAAAAAAFMVKAKYCKIDAPAPAPADAAAPADADAPAPAVVSEAPWSAAAAAPAPVATVSGAAPSSPAPAAVPSALPSTAAAAAAGAPDGDADDTGDAMMETDGGAPAAAATAVAANSPAAAAAAVPAAVAAAASSIQPAVPTVNTGAVSAGTMGMECEADLLSADSALSASAGIAPGSVKGAKIGAGQTWAAGAAAAKPKVTYSMVAAAPAAAGASFGSSKLAWKISKTGYPPYHGSSFPSSSSSLAGAGGAAASSGPAGHGVIYSYAPSYGAGVPWIAGVPHPASLGGAGGASLAVGPGASASLRRERTEPVMREIAAATLYCAQQLFAALDSLGPPPEAEGDDDSDE